MSVTIMTSANQNQDLNLSNSNFLDLWLALDLNPNSSDGTVGSVSSHELAVKCRRYKMVESVKGKDKALSTVIDGNMTHCGRAEGYLSGRVSQVLDLCELDLNAVIRWA
jgi:hypothetical protein